MKTSRILTQPHSAAPVFGLFVILNSKRVILPLKGVECDFSVVSGIAEVSVTQIFRQENKKPLDCEYLFPLPADASVYFCEADINGRTIRAQVRERGEARQLAAEKKAQGFRTALVESERDNLFTLSLGNVQPDDLVVITLKYFQTLRSLAGKPSLEIPFCPGVRYIPGKPLLRSNRGKGTVDDTDQVPDASRITPVRIDGEHPDAAYIEVRGALDGKLVDGLDVVSPSHPIVVHRTGGELRVTLGDKGEVPDRDFVLRWSEKNVEAVASRAWVREQGREAYALLEIRAPKVASAEREAMDFYFLVDRSGSMGGEKWNKAVEALQSCVQVLGPEDRVMLTFFESSYQDFAEGPMRARELAQDRQFQSVRKLGTAGGTELQPALEHVLDVVSHHSRQRRKNLILITDAQIGNDAAILKLMQGSPELPVHCFGIDVALNDELLLGLCRQQGGTFHSLNPNDDIQQAVTTLGKTLGEPVLLDLQLSEGWELADARIPNLYAGQIHYLSAKSVLGNPLELTARNGSSQPVRIQFERQTATGEASYLHWCRSRIRRLTAEGNDREAIALSVQSNLICRLTAFIAWDESEKVAVATHALVQPSMEDVRQCSFMRAPAAGSAVLEESMALYDEAPRTKSLAKKAGIAARLRQLIGSDLSDLRRELSGVCHQIGVTDWQDLLKSIFDWIAAARGDERARRIAEVNGLLREIKLLAISTAGPKSPPAREQSETAKAQIHERLSSFADKLTVGK